MHRPLSATLFALFLSFLAFPSVLFAATIPAGVQSTLWFSKDPLPVGETIQVFATIYNSGVYDLNGVVTLHHGTTSLDTKPFLVAGAGGATVVSFPYLVTPGSHSFSVSLEKLTLMSPDSSMATINPTIVSTESRVEKRTAVVSPTVPAHTPLASSTPALAGAEAIRDATALATSTAAKAAEKVEEVKARVEDSVPARVIAETAPVIGRVESFRVNSATDAHRRIVSVAQSLPASTSTPPSSTWGHLASGVTEGEVFKTPFRYIELFLLLLWNFLVAHPFVFYGLLLAFCYKVVRTVLGVLF
mgnify:CR=1 FL=1